MIVCTRASVYCVVNMISTGRDMQTNLLHSLTLGTLQHLRDVSGEWNEYKHHGDADECTVSYLLGSLEVRS